MDWLNVEGYPDPTAAEAIENVTREEMRKEWKPCVFICSPYAGDVTLNIEKAKRYLRFAVDEGAIPFAPHLLYPQVLKDENPVERELGLFFGIVWLGKCDEMWVFGSTISTGMAKEIAKARKRGIPIRYFTDTCQEVDHL